MGLVKIHGRFRSWLDAVRSCALHLCEIGTIDCIHDHCSEKRASVGAAAATAAMPRIREWLRPAQSIQPSIQE